MRCYDFPDIVIHDPSCPRYHGGVCHPLPTPVPPYTEDEAQVVRMHCDIIDDVHETMRTGRPSGFAQGMVYPTGTTAEPRDLSELN